MSHYPFDSQMKEKRRHETALCHSKAGFASSHPACEIVVEVLYNEYNLFWNALCPYTYDG